ncbi:MAG TPA: transglutaminase-like domain-containing protein [Smithella sp.]|nr:transglutaminase-like domain-containing protein [Smithella sp.]
MKTFKLNMLLGILIGIVFFTLLLIRLDFFKNKSEVDSPSQGVYSPKSQDIWMNIYQDNKKIGFIHRTLNNNADNIQFNEVVYMQINTMGVVQDIHISTEGHLNPDMTLSSFRFNLNSGIFRFFAQGQVTGNKLLLLTGSDGPSQKSEIPLRNIPRISGNIYDAAFRANMETNTSTNVDIFDPSSLSIREVRVTRKEDEVIRVLGGRILTKKFCADFMGAENCAWIDSNGEVLRESGILGLSMEKVTRQQAMEGIAEGTSIDFTRAASIVSNVKMNNVDQIKRIKYRISGAGENLFLEGGRQVFQDGILTVNKETLPAPAVSNTNWPEGVSRFLKPEPLIQSDDPQMIKQAGNIVSETDTPVQKARKIIGWVYHHLEKKPAMSVPSALEVLKNKTGDCNEHAVLAVALLRASGIPAQIEAGLVYLNGRFYYHAWCVLYLGEWITADAVFNQFPADVSHIRLVRGGSSDQLNLLGVMGKMKLEVLEQTI